MRIFAPAMTEMTEKNFNPAVAYGATLAAIVLWGLSYIWINQLLGFGIPVEYFVFVRVVVSIVILLVFNLICGYSLKIHKNLGTFFLLALCEPLIYFICETYGVKLTESPTYSALIISMTPVLAFAAGVVFFKEKITRLNVLGIIVCLAGLTLVTWVSSSVGKEFVWGVVLLMIAVVAEAGLASFTKILSGGYKASVIVMYQFIIGSFLLLPLFLTRGLAGFDPSLYFSWSVIRPILCLAVLCTAMAFTLWAVSVRNLGVAKAAVFQAMIPVVTAVASFILGQEFLTGLQWVGIAIACCGVVLTQLAGARR